MKRDLFEFVPSEITINILSRLSVRAIAMSKCVCKPWLDLLSTDDFVNSHLSKSVPALTVFMYGEEHSTWCNFFEFEDGDEADDDDDDVDRRYIPLTKFDFPHRPNLVAAADGLLLLANYETLYICNPMTREYVNLCCASEVYVPSYGFGSSRITGQHKVVQIVPKRYSECKRVDVYTLETGSWRSFEIEATTASFRGRQPTYGAFVNGNLHWIGSRSESFTCFDLETERFSMFSAPHLEETGCHMSICTLKDYLCMCAVMPSKEDGNTNYKFGVEIWLMKEYGVEISWTKEYVISLHPNPVLDMVVDMGVFDYFYPMKVFKDGDIMFSRGDFRSRLFHYSNKTQTSHKIGVLHPPGGYLYSLLLTPSFLSLKRNLGMENVISF